VRALTLKGVVVLSRIVGVLATVRNLPARTPRHFSSPLAAGTFLHVGIVVKDIAGGADTIQPGLKAGERNGVR